MKMEENRSDVVLFTGINHQHCSTVLYLLYTSKRQAHKITMHFHLACLLIYIPIDKTYVSYLIVARIARAVYLLIHSKLRSGIRPRCPTVSLFFVGSLKENTVNSVLL